MEEDQPVSIDLVTSNAQGFSGIGPNDIDQRAYAVPMIRRLDRRQNQRRSHNRYLKNTNVTHWLDDQAEKIHKKLNLNRI